MATHVDGSSIPPLCGLLYCDKKRLILNLASTAKSMSAGTILPLLRWLKSIALPKLDSSVGQSLAERKRGKF